MDKETFLALRKVVTYLWPDEYKSYLVSDGDPDHIYHSLQRLWDWSEREGASIMKSN